MSRTRPLDPAHPATGEEGVPEAHASSTLPETGPLTGPLDSRFLKLVESIPGIVYIETDESPSPTVYVSPRMQDILGYSPEPFVRDHTFWGELVHPDDLAGAREADQRASDTHDPYAAEYRMRDVEGRWHWFRDEAIFVPGTDGEPGYWQGLMIEITERKLAEEGLHEAAAKFQTPWNRSQRSPTSIRWNPSPCRHCT
jgi:PAS domain S-box-containing protein